MEDHKLCDRLATACLGLVWSSESDFPWEVVYWSDIQDAENLDAQDVLQYCDYAPETKIETTTLESFLTPATTEQEWHNQLERNQAKRYQLVQKLLQENLRNLQVYLVGKLEIDVYILGKSEGNAIIGLSTKAVET